MTIKKIIDRSDRDIPALNIVMDGSPIATLFYDKKKKAMALYIIKNLNIIKD